MAGKHETVNLKARLEVVLLRLQGKEGFDLGHCKLLRHEGRMFLIRTGCLGGAKLNTGLETTVWVQCMTCVGPSRDSGLGSFMRFVEPLQRTLLRVLRRCIPCRSCTEDHRPWYPTGVAGALRR